MNGQAQRKPGTSLQVSPPGGVPGAHSVLSAAAWDGVHEMLPSGGAWVSRDFCVYPTLVTEAPGPPRPGGRQMLTVKHTVGTS